MDNPFLWILIILIVIIASREICTWYWKINDIIKNQNEQLDQMDFLIGELSMQNKLLLRIVEQIEPAEQPEDKTKDNKSTP